MGRFPTLLGLVTGLLAALVLGVAVLAPLALTHRDAGAMEKLYGSAMVQVASRFGGGLTANPMANDPDALRMGRAAYTSSCAQCHGAKGDGRGQLGQATFPPRRISLAPTPNA